MTCFVFSTLRLEISFKMSVLRPSETIWGPSYEGFSVNTLFLISHYHIIMPISWWSYREDCFEVILNGFWRSSGRIFGPFWAHVQLKSRLGSSLRALLSLEVDFLSSTPTILEGFGELLGSILEIFWYLWSMLISSCTLIWFSDDFSLIFIPSGQAKVSKLHGK